jgi:hypothetical protein
MADGTSQGGAVVGRGATSLDDEDISIDFAGMYRSLRHSRSTILATALGFFPDGRCHGISDSCGVYLGCLLYPARRQR